MTPQLPSLDDIFDSAPAQYHGEPSWWLDDMNYAMMTLAFVLLIPIGFIDKVELHITALITFSVMFLAYLRICWQRESKSYKLMIHWIERQDLPSEHKTKLRQELGHPANALVWSTGRFVICIFASVFLVALLSAASNSKNKT